MRNRKLEEYKPNASIACKRTEAYWNRDLIDRPLIKAVIPKENASLNKDEGYYGRSFDDLDWIFKV